MMTCHLTPIRMIITKNILKIGIDNHVQKSRPWLTIGQNVNLYSLDGKWYESCSEIQNLNRATIWFYKTSTKYMISEGRLRCLSGEGTIRVQFPGPIQKKSNYSYKFSPDL